MKKLTAVFTAFIFVSVAYSQSHFRLHAGPVFNYLRSEGTGDFSKVKSGFTLGVGYEMVVAKNFSVQPEFNFMHLSAEEAITSAEVKFDYIQIPVLLKAVNNSRTFSFYLGPQLGFLTGSSAKVSGQKHDVKDNLTQTDFAGVVGIEYVLPASISLNARFIQGFSNVYKAEFDSPNTTRHEIFVLTVGYIFGKKK